MKSALIYERAFGRRESVAELASDVQSNFKGGLVRINQELWLVLSLFVIAGLFNWLVASHRMILGLYTLPTIFSAYVYGRRHAVLTATASIFIVLVLVLTNTHLFVVAVPVLDYEQWAELITWASLLLITAYAMGTLYDRKERHLGELRQTYFGLLTILQQFISNDKYTHNHSYRVALYASSIAARMGFDPTTYRRYPGSRPAPRRGQTRDQPGTPAQSGQPDTGRDGGNAKACRKGSRLTGTDRRSSTQSPPDHSCPPRQVRRLGIRSFQRRRDSH